MQVRGLQGRLGLLLLDVQLRLQEVMQTLNHGLMELEEDERGPSKFCRKLFIKTLNLAKMY